MLLAIDFAIRCEPEGMPLTESAEILERFSLSEDPLRLGFEVVVDDPAVFARPARIAGYWPALGEQIARFDCQPSTCRGEIGAEPRFFAVRSPPRDRGRSGLLGNHRG